MQVIRGLSDKVEQDHYLGQLAKSINVSRGAMAAKLKEQAKQAHPIRLKKASPQPEEDKRVVERRKVEEHLLSILLMQPKLRPEAKILEAKMLITPNAQTLLKFLAAHPDFDGVSKDIKELQSIGDYVKIVVLQFEELYRNLELIELHNEVARLQERLIGMYVKDQKKRVRKAMETASDADTRKLIEADKRLNDLLKQSKGTL